MNLAKQFQEILPQSFVVTGVISEILLDGRKKITLTGGDGTILATGEAGELTDTVLVKDSVILTTLPSFPAYEIEIFNL